jgi:NTP pyrophosphatase (non-canonical NTP hydrolase)
MIVRSVLGVMVFASFSLAMAQEELKPIQLDAPKQEESKHHFALKELDAFHETLHPLVHEALPEGNFDAIRENLNLLLEQAEAIRKAELPNTFSKKQESFNEESAKLVSQLKAMADMKDADNTAELEKAFDEMHEQFEKLAGMLR